jgi:hypothetical protein
MPIYAVVLRPFQSSTSSAGGCLSGPCSISDGIVEINLRITSIRCMEMECNPTDVAHGYLKQGTVR